MNSRKYFKKHMYNDINVEGRKVEPGHRGRNNQWCIVDIKVNGVEMPGEHINVESDDFNRGEWKKFINVPVGERVEVVGEVDQYRRQNRSVDYKIINVRVQ